MVMKVDVNFKIFSKYKIYNGWKEKRKGKRGGKKREGKVKRVFITSIIAEKWGEKRVESKIVLELSICHVSLCMGIHWGSL